MKRTDLPIPQEHIGLGEAFDRAYKKLERVEVIERDLKRFVTVRRDLMPGSMFPGEKSDLPCVTFEREIIGREVEECDGRKTSLHGLDQKALAMEDEAKDRSTPPPDALSAGDLHAYAYHPDGVAWGKIPDRDAWSNPNFAFPGLETFVDPDTSRGPDVRGSPVFLEEKEFAKWLARQTARLSDQRIRTGRRGRPSAMPLIIDEFKRRRDEGEVPGEGSRKRRERFAPGSSRPTPSPPCRRRRRLGTSCVRISANF